MSLPGGTHMSQPRFRYSMTVCVLALALVVPESAFSDAIRAAGRDAVPQTPIVNDDFYTTSSSQPIRHVHRTSRVHGRAAHAGKLLRDDGRQSDVDFLGSADPRRGACRVRRQRQRGVHRELCHYVAESLRRRSYGHLPAEHLRIQPVREQSGYR